MASLETLVEATLASSAAVVLVLLLRRPLRKAFGASVAYAAWALVPVSLLAVLLPAARVPVVLASFAVVPGEASQATVQPTLAALDPTAVAVACWVAGLFGCALWMVARQLRFRRSLGALQPRADGSREACRDVQGLPATLGLWMPQVIVPPGFDARYDAAQRELMLAHEHAHVRRGDLHANAVAAALRCLFWFNPLLHLAASRFRHDQELACDATVLAMHPAARRRYGEALLHAQIGSPAMPLGCHFGFGHPLRERIAMLGEQLPSVRRRVTGTVLVAAIAGGFGFAAWAAQPPQVVAPPPPPPPAPPVSPAPPAPPAPGDVPAPPPAPGAPPAPPDAPPAAPAPAAKPASPDLAPPKYPAYAVEHNLGGKVVLIVDVAADGSVRNATIERSEPKGIFDETALAAVRNWRFKPATKGGQPVASQVRVPINFRMDPRPGDEATPMQIRPGDPDPAAYDWVKLDLSAPRVATASCDVVKGNIADDAMWCGNLRR